MAALALATCARLLAIVEASQDRALGDAIADIGAKIDEHAGDLEADLGCDARLDRSEAEDFNRHIALDRRDRHFDRTQEQRPGAKTRTRRDRPRSL